MVKIDVSENVYKKLKMFKKVADVIMEKESEESEYVNIALSETIERLLLTITGAEENERFKNTILSMFIEDPQWILNFMAKMIKEGGEMQDEKKKELEEKWSSYIA